MTSVDDITQKMISITANVAQVDTSRVTAQSTLDQLGIDGTTLEDLTLEVERAFGVSISDEEREQMPTVQSFVDFVVAHPS